MKRVVLWLLGKLSIKDKSVVLQYLLDLAMSNKNDLHIKIELNEGLGLSKMSAFTGSR